MKFKITKETLVLLVYILIYIIFTGITKVSKANGYPLNATTEFTILMSYALFGVFLLFMLAWFRRKKERK